jgi:hypothetical protein
MKEGLSMFSQYPLAIVGRVKAGILEHMGVLLPNGHVAHCAPGRGEHVSTLQEFAGGQERVRIVRHVPPERHHATIGRIVEALRAPKPYDLLANNCEVFANRATGEEPNSPQLRGIVALLALVGLMSIAAAAR